MKSSVEKHLAAEVRLILQRSRQAWKLIPWWHRGSLLFASLLMAFTSAGNTAVAVLLGHLVDCIRVGLEQNWPRNSLYRVSGSILGAIALVYLVRETLNVVRRYFVENSCTRIHRDGLVTLVSQRMKLDLVAVTQEKVGALHGKIFRSVDGLVRLVRVMFLDFLPATLTGFIALATAVGKQPVLGLVMIGVVPLAVYLTVRQLLSQQGIRLQLMRDCEQIDGAVVEQLGGMEYVRVANTYAQEIQRLAKATELRRKRELYHHFQMSLFGFAKALNEGFFHIVVLGIATFFAINNLISFGDILTFSVLFLNVMTPLSEIHRVLDEGHDASLRVGTLLEMLDEPLDRSFLTTTTLNPRLDGREPVIVMDRLAVEYAMPDGKVKRALDSISIVIRRGETVGIAGRSGSGKSTWIKVLLRLTHPSSGTVLIGGAPLGMVSREEIARQFGYVGQNPFVFAGTIAENIAYGNEGATHDDIRHAAQMANLHDEIMDTPGGYEAQVTERGQNLSGGQRQRLAIARLLLKRAPILILDEATSALDNISERHVQRSLGITNTERTTILIAHRLTTLRGCDRILVFDEGRIVEIGTYDDLVRQGGLFTELVLSAENGIGDEPSSDNGPTSAEAAALPVPSAALLATSNANQPGANLGDRVNPPLRQPELAKVS